MGREIITFLTALDMYDSKKLIDNDKMFSGPFREMDHWIIYSN